MTTKWPAPHPTFSEAKLAMRNKQRSVPGHQTSGTAGRNDDEGNINVFCDNRIADETRFATANLNV